MEEVLATLTEEEMTKIKEIEAEITAIKEITESLSKRLAQVILMKDELFREIKEKYNISTQHNLKIDPQTRQIFKE